MTKNYSFSLFLLTFVFAQVLSAQQFSITDKLVPSDRDPADFFGTDLDIEGDIALISAIGDDEDENGNALLSNAGAAYIFERTASGEWEQTQKIVASDRVEEGAFGLAVAISGNYAIVTTIREERDASGENVIDDAGAAYVFERMPNGTWEEVQKLVASDRSLEDRFGRDVAIFGEYAVVTAADEDEDANGENLLVNAGAAYVFKRNASGVWEEVQKLVPSDRTANDLFGFSVAINQDYILIGAHAKDEEVAGTLESSVGAAYFFKKSNADIWEEEQKVMPTNPGFRYFFGRDVSLSDDLALVSAAEESFDAPMGDTVVARAGAAYVFHRDNTGNWSLEQRLISSDPDGNDYFGHKLDLELPYAFIGAYGDSEGVNEGNSMPNAGAAFVFHRGNDGTWTQMQKLVAYDRDESNLYGQGVAISNGHLLISASRNGTEEDGSNPIALAGAAYSYELMTTSLSANTFEVEPTLYPNPTIGPLLIDLRQNYATVTAKLFTAAGQLVYQREFEQTDQLSLRIDGAPGVYWLQLEVNDGQTGTWGIIKE